VPTRLANSKYRSREHLTPGEVEKLIEAAKTNRYGHRDATMLLVAYRHGLRASELCGLEWSQVDFNGATLHVRRAKNGKPATHPIRGDEMRALRKLQREAPKSAFVFVNERGTPFSPDGFNWLVKRAGQKAGLPFQVHAHMLRHSAGYKLAGDGHDTRAIQDYLGHRNISNTDWANQLNGSRNYQADGDGSSVSTLMRVPRGGGGFKGVTGSRSAPACQKAVAPLSSFPRHCSVCVGRGVLPTVTFAPSSLQNICLSLNVGNLAPTLQRRS